MEFPVVRTTIIPEQNEMRKAFWTTKLNTSYILFSTSERYSPKNTIFYFLASWHPLMKYAPTDIQRVSKLYNLIIFNLATTTVTKIYYLI